MLASPIVTYFDSLIPHLWLPQQSCELIERKFNLTWNSTLNLYLIDEAVHKRLLQENATLQFTLSNDLRPGSPNVTIVFPYGSLALELTPEYPQVTRPTRYFPIRRAANATQYTLGRAFFQHAYVIADYERRTFSVNQAVLANTQAPQLHEIRPPSNDSASAGAAPAAGGALPTAAMVGIAAGAVVVAVLLALGGLWIRWRRMRRGSTKIPKLHDATQQSPLETEGVSRFEIGGGMMPAAELPDKETATVELAAGEPEELAGGWEPCELDGEPQSSAVKSS